MHSYNNTVATRVTVHVQTVLLHQQQHTLAVVFATPQEKYVMYGDRTRTMSFTRWCRHIS